MQAGKERARNEPHAEASVLVGPLPPPHDGSSLSFAMLVEGFRQRGLPHRVVNLSSRTRQRLSAVWSLRRVLEYVPILVDLLRKLRGRGNVYVIIAQSRVGFLRDFLIVWASSLLGHRVLVHLKGGNYDGFYASQPRWIRALIRATLRRTARILVLSDRLRGMYDFEPALAPRIEVVPNGLPFEPGARPRGPKRIEPGQPVRVLYLSNLIERKGYWDVLEAARILRHERRQEVQFHFCGSFVRDVDDERFRSPDEAETAFRAFVTEHELSKEVKWVGRVGGAEKERELAEAHVFVLPTRYRNEGFPVSMIEAMAYGCVLVATRFRGIPDMLEDGRNGVFVEYGDPVQLADAIEAIARDARDFERMSAHSLERFQAHFTREAHLSRIVPLILET